MDLNPAGFSLLAGFFYIQGAVMIFNRKTSM